MPESPREVVEPLAGRWRELLARIERDVQAGAPVIARALAMAASEDEFHEVERALRNAASHADETAASLRDAAWRVGRLRVEWEAERRHDPSEARRLWDRLAAEVSENPYEVAQRWLTALLDALDWSRWDIADLLGGAMPWPPALREDVERLHAGVTAWARGDDSAGLAAMEALSRGEVGGLTPVLTPALIGRAHRLAAWIALRRLGDHNLAGAHLGAGGNGPGSAVMFAERAAWRLFIGDLERASEDAQQAIELAPNEPGGYFQLGAWAELTGTVAGADDLYRRGIALLPAAELSRLHTRLSLVDPTGRLLAAAAERLVEASRPAAALEVAREALISGIRGVEAHPQAHVHRIRSRALEALGDHHEAAKAALLSGQLCLWNGASGMALEEIERAMALDDSLDESGWLVAEALVSMSVPPGETLPDHLLVDRARKRWDEWARRVGPPRSETSWAYLTRAILEDLSTRHPDADRQDGIWQALMYVERALIHDEADPPRWGYAAQYLRHAGLEQLAFEAVERGYELSSTDRVVLAERSWQLARRGEFEAAEATANGLIRLYGDDASLDALRAWLALQRGLFQKAIALLEGPIATGDDLAWYHDMRAVCLIETGDVDAARADYRALLDRASPVDGATRCRLAMAESIVGDAERAQRWLEQARADPTTPRLDRHAATALAALAAGDQSAAGAALAEVAATATSAALIDDVLRSTRARAIALGGGGEEERAAVAESVDALVGRLLNSRRPAEPTAENELLKAIEDARARSADTALTALLAIRCRRQFHTGALASAATGYETLRGSAMEPEASIALTRALRELSASRAAEGDVEAVVRIGERLVEVGSGTAVEEALATAEALRAAGRLEEARRHVASARVHTENATERIAVETWLGSVSADLGDFTRARERFRAALDEAEDGRDLRATGQLHLRMAVLERLDSDDDAARRHLEEALRAWGEAGAADPAATLGEELRRLREPSSPDPDGRVTGALEWAASLLAAFRE
jgi:tetratricopeptide (TPR) repeat protein